MAICLSPIARPINNFFRTYKKKVKAKKAVPVMEKRYSLFFMFFSKFFSVKFTSVFTSKLDLYSVL